MGRAGTADDEVDTWAGRLGRFGLGCRGVVYLVLTVLTVRVIQGRGAEADQRGAFEAITRHPFGWVLVVAIAAGFAGLAAWQAWWAVRSRRAEEHKAPIAAAKALVYLAFAGSALSVVLKKSRKSGDQQTTDLTARLLRNGPGQVLVGVVGLAFCAGALFLVWKAWHRHYDVEVKVDDVPAHLRLAFEVLGVVGMLGRAVVVGLIGWFLLDAALTVDPKHAKGLDAALRAVARAPLGPWLLSLVALALACFGCFSLLEARYARC